RAERLAACSVCRVPESRIDRAPASHVARPVFGCERVEELVALEPVCVLVLEVALLLGEVRTSVAISECYPERSCLDARGVIVRGVVRSEEHTSELQSRGHL